MWIKNENYRWIQRLNHHFRYADANRYIRGTLFLIWQKLRESWIEYMRLPIDIAHVGGPKKVVCRHDAMIVVALMKNEELLIKTFIEHYQQLGVSHVFLLDNGSTDKTISIAARYPHVSIFKTHIPFKGNNTAMRRYMVKRFGKNCWVLCVDLDELFDYPGSNTLRLREFLAYLNHHGYTGVVTHMLDMFSDRPLSQLKSRPGDDIKRKYPFFDISKVTHHNYFKIRCWETGRYFSRRNILPHDRIAFYRGGIRSAVFGLDDVYLTKHALMFVGNGVKPVTHQHFIDNAKIADVTCVLYHYKFLDNFIDKAKTAVKTKHYAADSYDYAHYHDTLEKKPDLMFMQPTSQELQNVDALVVAGFLMISEDYAAWVKRVRFAGEIQDAAG